MLVRKGAQVVISGWHQGTLDSTVATIGRDAGNGAAITVRADVRRVSLPVLAGHVPAGHVPA